MVTIFYFFALETLVIEDFLLDKYAKMPAMRGIEGKYN